MGSEMCIRDRVWTVFVKFICPIVITLVLLNALGVDLFGEAPTPEAAKPE